MSLTIPVDFTDRANIRGADYVALVHIYYSGVSYYRLATKSCVVDGSQYLGIVENVGSLTESWNLFDNNSVSVSVPSITVTDYTTETGFGSLYRFSDVLGEAGIIGNNIDIYVGFIGTSLAGGYVKIFAGTIENIELGSSIEIQCRGNELPDDIINGRRLSYQNKTLGGVNVSGILTIPKEADGLYLPVALGQHWNAPMVCFNAETFGTSTSDGIPSLNAQTFWCENDTDYDTGLISGHISRIKNYYQPNTGQNSALVYLYQEGMNTGESRAAMDITDGDFQLDGYVPGYEIGYRGGRNFQTNVFISGGLSIPGIKINYPTASGGINLDSSWFCNVPLRMWLQDSDYYYTSGIYSHDGAGSIANIFDGNQNTKFRYSNSGISSPQSIYVAVDLPLDKNIRTDEGYRVYRNRPVFTPEKQITDDEYNMLLMGRSVTSVNVTRTLTGRAYVDRYFYAFLGYSPGASNTQWLGSWDGSGASAWNNFIGISFFGRNGSAHTYTSGITNFGYNFLSYPFITNKNASGHLIDFANDQIGYSQDDTGYGIQFIGDAGNMEDFAPAWMGTYPFLQRKALNKDLKGILQFSVSVSGGIATEDIYDVYWEAYETIPYDLGGYIYTNLSGISVVDVDLKMLSAPNTASTALYMLSRPIEYLELIYQAKFSGIVEGDFNYNEWEIGDDDWDEVYGNVRDKSGFVLIDEIGMKQFVQEYCENELWTSYRDNLGKLRFVIIPRDPENIVLNSVTVSYEDLVNFKTFYSSPDKLCTEVKSVKTDYVYANETFVNDTAWRVEDSSYDYGYWKRGNSQSNNSLVKENIDKKYTSYTTPSVVSYNSKYWTCQISNLSSAANSPQPKRAQWAECTSGLIPASATAWSSGVNYYGYDAEARSIASLYINQWCNLHRMVEFETNVLKYLELEIGDIVEFADMPGKILGLTLQGWNGDTSTTSVIINGQAVTFKFIVTSLTRTVTGLKITVMQLHKLDDITVVRTR